MSASNSEQNEISVDNIRDVTVEAETAKRLAKLDYYFTVLRLDGEACRQRILCEVASEADVYSPLSDMFKHETR